MPATKRKALSVLANEDGKEETMAEKKKLLKRPAAASADEPEEDVDMEESSEEQSEEEETELSEEQMLAKKKQEEKKHEKELADNREKELKSMPAADLKKLLVRKDLQTGSKADMIQTLLKCEAKERAALREKEANIRAVVVKKKEELEAKSISQLKELCIAAGIQGTLSKESRIEVLLKDWLEDDGVNKALTKAAFDKREAALIALDKPELLKICNKAGLDPFLKDVIIDRIIKREIEMGKFLKPVADLEKDVEPPQHGKVDMVEALLAHNKQTEELAKKRTEEAAIAAKQIKDLKAKSTEELTKLVAKKRLDVSGKKDDLIQALYVASLQEEALKARIGELKSLGKEELTELVSKQGLKASKSKDGMIEAILSHEKNTREQLKAYDAKMLKASAKHKEEMQENTGAELKDMCIKKGLAGSGTNEDRIQRLVDAAQRDGELDQVIEKMDRDARRVELDGMEKVALVSLCEELGADPLVKEVMVERVIFHEKQSGGPIIKKART